MIADDVDYYVQRAETEIAMAQRANDSRVVQAHYQLASLYLERIYGEASPESA